MKKILIGIILLFLMGCITNPDNSSEKLYVCSDKSVVVSPEFCSLFENPLAARTPPYILIEGREVTLSFKKSDGGLIAWNAEIENLENAILRGDYKRNKIKNVFVPMMSSYFQGWLDYCEKNNQDCTSLVEEHNETISKLKAQGLNTITVGDGNTVIDYSEFVDSNFFSEIMPSFYQSCSSDKEFIYEIWNVVRQLTVYSNETTDTPRYPQETLLMGGGDCEDTAILVASMLKAVGEKKDWTVQLVYMDLDNPSDLQTANHLIVWVETPDYNTFIETTAKNKGIGYWQDTIDCWHVDV